MAQRLFIGTSNPRPGNGDGPGIFAAFFKDGQLTEPQMVAEGMSPSFLTIEPVTNKLFTVLGGDYGSAVAASYTTAAADETARQTLKLYSQADCGSPGGCHVALSDDGRILLSANYTGSTVASFLINDEGTLSVASVMTVAPGAIGPNASRQEAPHPHSVVLSPDGNFVLVNDLGLDCILIFTLARATGELSPHMPDRFATVPGAGPRHMLVHPGGQWIYSINELNSTIDQLAWNPTLGTLTLISTISTVPPGMDTFHLKACEMILSTDTRFLYASNRDHDSFAVFTIDAETGALTKLQELPNPGRESRHIAIDPSGKYFLSANQFSGDISVFPLDQATGLLSPRTSFVPIEGPSCLLFA